MTIGQYDKNAGSNDTTLLGGPAGIWVDPQTNEVFIADGYANATINREMAALKRAFRLAHRAGRVAAIPYIDMLDEDNARKGFFEPDQLATLLTHLPEYLRPVFRVAYITGWRVKSELLTRQWRHVDFDHGWLRIEPGEDKSRAGRMFPFTTELREALKAQQVEVGHHEVIVACPFGAADFVEAGVAGVGDALGALGQPVRQGPEIDRFAAATVTQPSLQDRKRIV
jgi:integrase